jgi:hypothetical protein
MKYLYLIIILIFTAFSYSANAEEKKPDDCKEFDERPQCLFDVDEDGTIHTDDGEAERTFSFPPLKTGFVLDLKHPDLLPFISVELLCWDMLGESFAFDLGGTAGRAFISFNWETIPIMKLGPTIWGGWNVPEKEYSFGFGFTIIKF